MSIAILVDRQGKRKEIQRERWKIENRKYITEGEKQEKDGKDARRFCTKISSIVSQILYSLSFFHVSFPKNTREGFSHVLLEKPSSFLPQL